MATEFIAGRGMKANKHFPVKCDPCQFKDKFVVATAFCQICKEFLCNGCSNTHRGNKLLKEHKLVYGDALKDVIPERFPAFPFQFCDSHRDQLVDHFCLTHQEVICTACKVVNHRVCRRVEHIPSICKGASETEEAATFLKSLKSQLLNLKRLKINKWIEFDHLESKKKQCVNGMLDLRRQINKYLDKLQAVMVQQIDDIVTKTASQLKADLSALEITIKSIDDSTKWLDDASRSSNDQAFFVAMKKINQRKMDVVIKDFEADLRTFKVDFKGDFTLAKMQDQIKSLGVLQTDFETLPEDENVGEEDDEEDLLPVNVPVKRVLNMHIKKVGEVNVASETDENTCCITSSTFLDNGRLLVTDHGNQTIKLLRFDYSSVASLQLPSKPWDIASFDDSEAIVTLPYEKNMQVLKICADELSADRVIETTRSCWGVFTKGDIMYVTCHDNPGKGEVIVVGKNGAVIRRYGRRGDGTFMFTGPFYVAVNPSADKMFVSDYYDCSVTCLSLEAGAPLYSYREQNLKPETILPTGGDRIVVCCRSSNTVRILSKDGKHLKTVLSMEDGLNEPNSFAFRSSDMAFVVGWLSSTVLVYRFE